MINAQNLPIYDHLKAKSPDVTSADVTSLLKLTSKKFSLLGHDGSKSSDLYTCATQLRCCKMYIPTKLYQSNGNSSICLKISDDKDVTKWETTDIIFII